MSGRIIGILRDAEGFVSGGRISRELGLTRAAVWKRIHALREKGFVIDASSGRGYRLIETPDFSVEELKTLVRGRFGKEIIYLDKVDSTNDYAIKSWQGGQAAVILADCQTKGKGRLGRKWSSPPGANIYMSVIFRPEIPPKDATLLTLLSAVSCASALREMTGLDATIKWPNDIMLEGKKAGGILLEMRSEPDRITFAVIGIGINVNIGKSDFPSEIRPFATSLSEEAGRKFKRTPLIAGILNEVERNLEALSKKGRSRIIDKWRELSSTLGKNVIVTAGEETLKGIAEDIDAEGRLILRTQKGLRTISSGDLTMLR